MTCGQVEYTFKLIVVNTWPHFNILLYIWCQSTVKAKHPFLYEKISVANCYGFYSYFPCIDDIQTRSHISYKNWFTKYLAFNLPDGLWMPVILPPAIHHHSGQSITSNNSVAPHSFIPLPHSWIQSGQVYPRHFRLDGYSKLSLFLVQYPFY